MVWSAGAVSWVAPRPLPTLIALVGGCEVCGDLFHLLAPRALCFYTCSLSGVLGWGSAAAADSFAGLDGSFRFAGAPGSPARPWPVVVCQRVALSRVAAAVPQICLRSHHSLSFLVELL